MPHHIDETKFTLVSPKQYIQTVCGIILMFERIALARTAIILGTSHFRHTLP